MKTIVSNPSQSGSQEVCVQEKEVQHCHKTGMTSLRHSWPLLQYSTMCTRPSVGLDQAVYPPHQVSFDYFW